MAFCICGSWDSSTLGEHYFLFLFNTNHCTLDCNSFLFFHSHTHAHMASELRKPPPPPLARRQDIVSLIMTRDLSAAPFVFLLLVGRRTGVLGRLNSIKYREKVLEYQ